MGRLMTFIGVALIVAGFGGLFAGNFSAFNLNDIDIGSLVATPTTAELCKAGETLVNEKGATQYTQGQGYASPIQYFCENSDGVRRDVTGDFVTGLMGQASGFMADIGKQFGKSILWGGMISLGFVLMIIGMVMTRIRAGGTVVRYGPQVYVNGQPMGPAGQIYMNSQSPTPPMGTRSPLGTSGGSLADKLRQLESARNAGLITSDEYDQARQAIIKDV